MAFLSASDDLEDRITEVRRRDRRFGRNAYFFVLDALDYTMLQLGRDELTGEERHVGARELLAGIQEYAVDQFGAMASLVFEQWGARTSEDFGEVVFNLIDAGLLSRRPQDTRLDFIGAADFMRAFAEKRRERLASISTSRSE
jgi:uncharacterized repeat protein (TIGR04138 family)